MVGRGKSPIQSRGDHALPLLVLLRLEPVLDTMGRELYFFVHQASQCLEWVWLTNNYTMVSCQHHPAIKTVFLVRQITPPAKLADQQVCEYTTSTARV